MSNKKLIKVPLGEIFADQEFNCRGQILMTDCVDLAKSIQKQGLIQPVSVVKMTEDVKAKALEQAVTPQQKLDAESYEYYLLAGFRRYLAHRVNESPTIDAIVIETEMTHGQQIAFNLSENLSREQLNIVQEARTMEKLFHEGYAEGEIMELINASRGWVQIRGMVLKLPEPIQESAALGELAQADIRKIYTEYRNGGEDAAINFAKRIKDSKKKGRSATSPSSKNTKKIRTKGEMLNMLDHLAECPIPVGLHTRILAWAAGEISDEEVYGSIKDEAEVLSLEYMRP